MENMRTPDVYHDVWMFEEGFGEYDDKPYAPVYDLEKIHKSINILSMVILSMVCVLGVLGNGVVIWVTGFRMKKTVSTVWYLNLAVADFLVTALLPLVITRRSLDFHWSFGWFMCKMHALVFYVNMYASVFSLLLISVDRCVCVVWTRNHRTVRKASWVSLGVWATALALSSPYFIVRHTVTSASFSGDIMVRCFDDYVNTTVSIIGTSFLVGFVGPFSVIVSCYSVINEFGHQLQASQSGRSFKIIEAVIATFFLCWLPFHITQLINMCYQNGLIESSETLGLVLGFTLPITLTLALLKSCVNPLLYLFSQGFKDVFRSRSILKVLEKAFAEERPQTNNTPTDPDVTRPMIALSEIEGSTDPPGTQDLSP